MSGDVEGGHFVVGDLNAVRVGSGVEFAPDRQAGLGRGTADQIDDGRSADQRFSPAILCDVAEHSMFDLVPLRGAWRIVTHLKGQAGLVGEFLELDLPESDT